MGKIVTLDWLTERKDTRVGIHTVLAHGCFDLLHIGHIRHFKAAKKLGDRLVVTITPDRFITKGSGRPVFSEELRMEAVAALECVDFVALNEWPTAVETIKLLKPRYYVKGGDVRFNVTQALEEEGEAVKSVGGDLVFTHEIEYHSTDVLNLIRASL